MKSTSKFILAAALVSAVGASVSAISTFAPRTPIKPAAAAVVTPITGDYVEARTASVFAGACHYNGELVTTGRDAVMAWSFTGGSYNGVSLSGVRAAAAVTSQENLSDSDSPHSSQIIVDASASPQQANAVVALLKAKCADALGTVKTVGRAPIAFSHTDAGYTVDATGFAAMNIQYMPDDACCVQPHLVWYSPLTPLDHRKVGFTDSASYTGTLADHWYRSGENGAFYGQFTF